MPLDLQHVLAGLPTDLQEPLAERFAYQAPEPQVEQQGFAVGEQSRSVGSIERHGEQRLGSCPVPASDSLPFEHGLVVRTRGLQVRFVDPPVCLVLVCQVEQQGFAVDVQSRSVGLLERHGEQHLGSCLEPANGLPRS